MYETKQQLQRIGHVTRMNNRTLQKQVLYGQLLNAKRRTNGQKLRYKDMLGHQLQNVGINQYNWESLASDRLVWQKKVSSGIKKCEYERIKKIRRKATHRPANGSRSNYKSICVRSLSLRLSFSYWSLCT